jgi:Domain of unknown function (DUF4386)
MQGTSAQTYARIAGVLFLVSAVAGGFGEVFVPSQLIVSSDAAATARNILAPNSLFRLGFASYLIEAGCDVSLTLILYVLLRPISNNLALLAVFFRLVATATFAATELFYVAPALILSGADYLKSFSPDQLNTLALLTLRLYAYYSGLFMALYGVASVVLGYLMYRSDYFPRLLGVLLALSGVGFVVTSFAQILAPAYASFLLILPTAVAGLALALWLLIRGVDVTNWNEKVARAG